MLLDHPQLAARYFFPRQVALPGAIRVRCAGGELACFRSGDDPTRPTIIFFHGNGEVVADYLPDFARELNALGVNVFFAEYRGYGASTGTPTLAAMLDDVDAIFAAAGAPEERTIAFGRSVGSIYAIELVKRHPRIAGLVLESGIADVLERVLLRVRPEELGGDMASLEAEASRLLDHQAKLGAYRGKLLVLHAQQDTLVLPSHAQRNHDWAASADKRLVLLPAGDHNSIFVFNHETYLAELRSFVDRCRTPM
jgi:pimeloyl-ACP methyl ester carboxylesterase